MSRIRLAAVAATLSCGLLLGAASTAGAQAPAQDLTKKIDVTGTAKNGKKFTGTYTINRFISRGGKVLAVGKLKGRLKNRRVSRTGVRIPVTGFADQGAAQSAQLVCRILTLTLGPLDLNLLGLRIQLNQVNLRITAIPWRWVAGRPAVRHREPAQPACASGQRPRRGAQLAAGPRTHDPAGSGRLRRALTT